MLSRLTSKSTSMVSQIPKRSFIFAGKSKTYFSGHERALMDKMNVLKVPKHLSMFTLFGLVNAFCFGLSYTMSEKDYIFHFSYKQNGRYSDMIKSQFGSTNPMNVAWTAPSLILGGHYMQSKLGSMRMLQFTSLAMASIFFFKSAFGPNPNFRAFDFKPLEGMFPKLHSNGFHKEYGYFYMGADQMAASVILLGLLYHRMLPFAYALAACDILYYGPQHIGGCLPAFVAAWTIL